VGLRERALDVTRPILVVLDGSKALHRDGAGGVGPVFGFALLFLVGLAVGCSARLATRADGPR
jgi:hypothetical protein